MPRHDPARLRRALLAALHAPETARVREPGGWVALSALPELVASRVGGRPAEPEVAAAVALASRGGEEALEVEDGRVRLATRPRDPERRAGGVAGGGPPAPGTAPHARRGPRGHAPSGPDIVYHATTAERVAQVRQRGALAHAGGGPIHLSRLEAHAWRVAHRSWDEPMVLYIDAARARREGVRIERTRSGHYAAESIPIRHVMNLREGFAEQASAGGFLVDWASGAPRIALIRVQRRGGGTWEVAKGKLEPGESPEMAAAREVREEMGIAAEVAVTGTVGTVRYGFSTPDGAPRLKTIYLYLLETADGACAFSPARGEGIDAVHWFEVREALDSLAHPSLRGAIERLVDALDRRAAELGLAAVGRVLGRRGEG